MMDACLAFVLMTRSVEFVLRCLGEGLGLDSVSDGGSCYDDSEVEVAFDEMSYLQVFW